MGNSGSIQNVSFDSSGRSKSELNGYFQHSRLNVSLHDSETHRQTLLCRKHNQNSQTLAKTKSFPLAITSEQFKVLPQIGLERHKLLRQTSNGIVLQSGGTISGRNKDDTRAPVLMQRSRTLILDHSEGVREKSSNELAVLPKFQRSQTLLHLSHKTDEYIDKKETNKKFICHKDLDTKTLQDRTERQQLRHACSEPDFRNDLNRPTHARKPMDTANVVINVARPNTTKLNRYNKKRKAPPAPSTTATIQAGEENFAQDKLPVTRRFRSNVNNKAQHHQQDQQQQPSQQKNSQQFHVPEKGPSIYRREKSCDAILLRSKNEGTETVTAKNFSSDTKTSYSRQQTKTPAKSMPKQASKIPQLKRTFYFGMQTAATEKTTTENLKPEELADIQKLDEKINVPTLEEPKTHKGLETSDAMRINSLNNRLPSDEELTIKYNDHTVVDEESTINDNGILIHLRPALPRKKLEVPSFSPHAAWRMLANIDSDSHGLMRHGHHTPKNNSDSLNCESPIRIRNEKIALEMEKLRREQPTVLQKNNRKEHLHAMTWTPQQDLGDEDDDDDYDNVNNEENNCTSSSDDFGSTKDEEYGMLFFNDLQKNNRNNVGYLNNENIHKFSLSLPRDINLDANLQKRSFETSNNNFKAAGLSSLQKLKFTISGNNKCTCKTSLTNFATNNMEASTDEDICAVHGYQPLFRSDNWVLHKTGSKDGANTNILIRNNRKLLNNGDLATVEPLSLSFLTGGKHIMYLPGKSTLKKDRDLEESGQRLQEERIPTCEGVTKSTTTRQRPRQRKKDTRESLQDENPILKHHQTHSQQQSQRFSFQSTVRMVEKRRLAEKLSRDVEIREAQRKSELEAMKRVEEDFQRKRASEKANIRQQLRLYCGNSTTDVNTRDQFNSLPNSKYLNQPQHDTNNNKISTYRADPDGAPSASPLVVSIEPKHAFHEISHLPLKRMDSNCGDSDIDLEKADIAHFNRTASMVEPYLQSFMK